MSDPYRRLLAAYPLEWREQHGAVVLAMQRESDLARGRRGPRWTDRAAFLVRGLAQRSRRRHPAMPSLSALVDAPVRFDQSNGTIPEGTDALDRRGLRIDRHHGRGGLNAAGAAPDGLMEPLGWGR